MLSRRGSREGVCLGCSCIIITNPKACSTSQTSSPKASERSRASAINDESCVSMVLGGDLAAACSHCVTLIASCWTIVSGCLIAVHTRLKMTCGVMTCTDSSRFYVKILGITDTSETFVLTRISFHAATQDTRFVFAFQLAL